MSASPTNEEIKEALAQSGYLMEQEVATQLENLGYHVWTNAPFQDPDEGKSREMDVRAIQRFLVDEKRKIAAFIEVVVECKNSDNPYVFIKRRKNASDNNYEPVGWKFPFQNYEMKKVVNGKTTLIRQRPSFFHLEFDKVRFDFLATDKAVQFCRIDRNGRNAWQANHGGLYDAIFFPMAKAIMSRVADAPKSGSGQDEWKYFWFIFPMVILSGRLLEVDSNDQTGDPKDVNFVNFRRDLKSKSLDGRFSVDFVRQAAIEEFHSTCIAPVMEHTRRLVTEEADKILKKEAPWIEDD